MNSYHDFAFVYDNLMKQDIDYHKWTDYIENIFSYYNKDITLIADLACGTGNITIPLAQRGYEMIGVDLSENMLTVARDKAFAQMLSVLFLNQNIIDVDLYGTVDAFLCMIDGINYILSPQSLLYMFKRIKTCFLEPNGIFIFDISSRYKLSDILGNHTFVHNNKDIFYTWQNRYIPSKRLSDMYLNFFIKEGETYHRFEERHLQRAYSEKELRYLLKQAGFTKIDTYSELSFDPVSPASERIVFAAQ